MSQCVDREVFSQRWRENLPSPVKGKVYRGEAFGEVPGRVLSPELVEGGEG